MTRHFLDSVRQERTGDEVQSLLNQAEICVAEARLASSLGRHNSAAGLLSTAAVIYHSVVRIPAVEADEELCRRVQALWAQAKKEGQDAVGA